jgi:uncharacterized protein YegP (UPF0339 family)
MKKILQTIKNWFFKSKEEVTQEPVQEEILYKIELKKSNAKRKMKQPYYFLIKAGNNKTIAVSEMYTTMAMAKKTATNLTKCKLIIDK